MYQLKELSDIMMYLVNYAPVLLDGTMNLFIQLKEKQQKNIVIVQNGWSLRNYCKNNTGVYADLFKRHSDKVHLISKTMDFLIENYGINLPVHITLEKGKYSFEITGNNGDDVFSGTFQSENFSEVLEKVRISTGILTELSKDFSININELSNDKVEEWIKWEG